MKRLSMFFLRPDIGNANKFFYVLLKFLNEISAKNVW